MLKIGIAFCSFSNSGWSTYAHGVPRVLRKSISLYSPIRSKYRFNRTSGIRTFQNSSEMIMSLSHKNMKLLCLRGFVANIYVYIHIYTYIWMTKNLLNFNFFQQFKSKIWAPYTCAPGVVLTVNGTIRHVWNFIEVLWRNDGPYVYWVQKQSPFLSITQILIKTRMPNITCPIGMNKMWLSSSGKNN